ncbi:unnamed protein product [Heligmosomoides polygyrus]|uniref:Uncharacterized protein n=1 Tax=Heligmosomoides polygyrus TaxID=6339 RepID=A0A183G3H0_HELPZ|nr:unnamed protein product [Heligmosomoides polygyrus]
MRVKQGSAGDDRMVMMMMSERERDGGVALRVHSVVGRLRNKRLVVESGPPDKTRPEGVCVCVRALGRRAK